MGRVEDAATSIAAWIIILLLLAGATALVALLVIGVWRAVH